MFGKKKEKQIASVEPVASSFSHDLIVHNMPSHARISGNFSGTPKVNEGRFGLTPIPQKQNFKMVGFIIIIFGAIVIGALVYLSYRFIISPTANKNKPTSTIPLVTEVKKDTTTETVITPVPTSTPVVMATTTALELVAVASTTPLMNEDLTGQDGQILPPVLDTDTDTLTDDEELVMGTSATLADSDGDKFNDATEISKGFNPAGSGPLSANANLTKYTNTAYKYSLLYPSTWQIKSLAEEATAVFIAPEDSLIQISVQDNPDKSGIQSWYESAFSPAAVSSNQIITLNGWEGVMGADNLNFYLTDAKHANIYVVSYIPAVGGRLVYPNIYKLMLNSLVIK